MQVDTPAKIRNVALVGHNDTGKTTLASALLYSGGAVNRMARVEEKNTVTDFDPEELARGISIGAGVCFVPWRQHKINLIDCPGYGIFFTETKCGMRAADSALLCVNGVAGVEVTTENAWDCAAEMELPLLVHLTKMDRERADLGRTLEGLQKRFGRGIVPIQLPLGSEHQFSGVVDLVKRQAFVFDRDGSGKAKEVALPSDVAATVEEWRAKLIEAVAETDDALMEKFFETGTLPDDDLREGLRRAVRTRKLFPLTVSAGLHCIGTSTLLDVLVDVAPSPADRGGFLHRDRLDAFRERPAGGERFPDLDLSGRASHGRLPGASRRSARSWARAPSSGRTPDPR